jgi:hypothetical protein
MEQSTYTKALGKKIREFGRLDRSNQIHIFQNLDNHWAVKIGTGPVGAKFKDLKVFNQKSEAIRFAKAITKKTENGVLIVHDKSGDPKIWKPELGSFKSDLSLIL